MTQENPETLAAREIAGKNTYEPGSENWNDFEDRVNEVAAILSRHQSARIAELEGVLKEIATPDANGYSVMLGGERKTVVAWEAVQWRMDRAEKALSASAEGEKPQPNEHDWDDGTQFGYSVCRKCCVVKRRDGKNKPCRPARLREMEVGLVDEEGRITPVDTTTLNTRVERRYE